MLHAIASNRIDPLCIWAVMNWSLEGVDPLTMMVETSLALDLYGGLVCIEITEQALPMRQHGELWRNHLRIPRPIVILRG